MAQEINATTLVSDANLQGYWRLESAGTDSGPNGYNLTENGGFFHVTGNFGNGVDLEASGLDDYLSITHASGGNLSIAGPITLYAWIKREATGAGNFEILSKMSNGNAGYQMYIAGDNILHFTHRTIDLASTTSLTSTSSFYQVAGTYDGTTFRLYINGVQEDSDTSGGTNSTNTVPFDIGASHQGAGDTPGAFWDGLIDDVAVFNRALSGGDILALYNGTFGGSSSASASISPSASASPSGSASRSASPSASRSPSASTSVSPSSSLSQSASLSPSRSSSPSLSPSASLSQSQSISPSVSTSQSSSVSPSAEVSTYTRTETAALPTDAADLVTTYTSQEETDVSSSDDVRVSQSSGTGYMIHQFKNSTGSHATCTINLECRSSVAASTSTVYLQIYNQNSLAWETLDSNSFSLADVDFTFSKAVSSLTNYKDGNNVISVRVHQLAQ